MLKYKTEPFYFSTSGKPLFGCYHAPVPGFRRDCGVVLCYPMGEEYVRFHRAYLQLAGYFSNAGFPVLRFDFYGCGDSAGDCEQGEIGQWLDDISTAIGEIKNRCDIGNICLVGLRLGGSLSMMAGTESGGIDSMVLWDPVVEGRAYIEELLEWHQDLLRYSHVKQSDNITYKRPWEILGFPVTESLIVNIENINLLAIQQKPAENMLIIETHEKAGEGRLIEHLKSMGAYVEFQHSPSPQIWKRSDRFWIEDLTRVAVPHQVLKSIVTWVSERYL